MPDNFEFRKSEDGRVLIVLHSACAISKEAIVALLAKLDVEESQVVFLSPEDLADCNGIDDIPVVIPIDQASCNAPELDAAGRHGAGAGGRVIILFGDDCPYQGLHPIAEKYGTQCGWSAGELDGCLKRPDPTPPLSSNGTPVIRPKPEQVKC